MQKISIKREQSQAGLSFAEREKFRPQVKNKLLLLLVLLLTAATGAWAQEPATTYSVKMKSGTVDAGNWTIASGEKSAKGDAADGLTGLSEKDAVTLTYNGRLKVKGVKAVSDAAAPAVPDGALSGVFSVSSTKQVYFSKGNLRYASGAWSFFDNQYDYYTDYSADAWDKFGWSTSATTYGMNTATSNSAYSGDFVDWGATMGTGWFTLSKDEWTYLFNTRSASTVGGTENGRYAKAKVNDVQGVILFPDTYTHPDGVTAPTGVNAIDETGWDGNTYTVADWTKMESAGCVFLPVAGKRYGSEVDGAGTFGHYSSATPEGTGNVYDVYISSGYLEPADFGSRILGYSVRLVQAVSDAPAAGNIVDLSTLTADYEAQNGDVLTGVTTSYKVTIAAGATVTLDGATISGDSYCIKCLGDATIILKDGSTNTLTGTGGAYPALSIGDANTTLTIQGSMGVLNVTSGQYCAGIGGGYKNNNHTCGNIRIEGGVINAQGGYNGAGIGTDSGKATCGDIIITGGTITAKGGNYAAGIGTGYGSGDPAVCGAITIANTVTKVTATKGENAPYSIGKGYGDKASCGTVTIGGTVYWQNNAAVGDGDTYLAQATIEYPAPAAPTGNIVDLSTLTADYEAQNGDVLTGTLYGPTKPYKITIADGATVTLDNAVINGVNDTDYEWAGLNCLGNATIVLKDGSTNTVRGFYENYPGILVPENKTLTIQGGSEGTGKLTASPFDGGTDDSYGTGIGGGYDIPSGDISIEGGVITATGGFYAAGIGGVFATCGNISITGGTVTATGGANAAGIGSGEQGTCGNITIANTVTKVTATNGENDSHSIGKGDEGSCGTVTIGGTVYWQNNAAVNGGDTYLATSPLIYEPSN